MCRLVDTKAIKRLFCAGLLYAINLKQRQAAFLCRLIDVTLIIGKYMPVSVYASVLWVLMGVIGCVIGSMITPALTKITYLLICAMTYAIGYHREAAQEENLSSRKQE
jgi:hypothetical protein